MKMIRVLQPISSQLDPNSTNFLPEARAGQFLCDGVVSDHIYFSVDMAEYRWTEWLPRSKGGGPVKDHTIGALAWKTILRNGNELVATLWYTDNSAGRSMYHTKAFVQALGFFETGRSYYLKTRKVVAHVGTWYEPIGMDV